MWKSESIFFSKIELSDNDFSRVSRVVYEHCGINLKSEKRALVQSRLAKLVRSSGFSSYSDYLDYVLRDPDNAEFTDFIDRLSTNLTSFFRENRHFDYLKSSVLPRLTAGSAAPRVRCWSAGCSSGQEPYSLAMTIAEFIPEAKRANVKILASDISTQMVSTAKMGRYPKAKLDGIDSALLKKYFSPAQGAGSKDYQVSNELRKMIVFKQINLMKPWPITTMVDIIFCRNVMIYFDKQTQQSLINRFYDQLVPGGMLFIGHSESLSGTKHSFKYMEPTIYRKEENA